MALKATIYKTELAIADMTRHYYQTHSLTLAQHPSETLERMMLRLVAFALCADERLLFGKGISEDSEPDLWQHNLSGEIELWVELGLPDEKLLRRALEADPAFVPALNNLGCVLMEMGKAGEARVVFQQAFALDSGQSDSIRENLRLAIAESESSVYVPPEEKPEFSLVRRGQGRYVLLSQL